VTAILLPNGKQQYFTTAGLPAVGYKIATFDAGTSNPRVTWSDALKVGVNTNPVILDGRGEASIFWEGAYKVQLQDSTGAVIWTQDNLQSQQTTFTASLIPAVTNTVDIGSVTLSWRNLYLGPNNAPVLDTVTGNIGYYARTAIEIAAGVVPVSFIYPVGNVFRYYTTAQITQTQAFSSTPTLDCSAAINNAVKCCTGDVFFPTGIHYISAPIYIPTTATQNVRFVGESRTNTKIEPMANSIADQLGINAMIINQATNEKFSLYRIRLSTGDAPALQTAWAGFGLHADHTVAWTNSVNYVAGALVTSGGNTYVCILANINQAPPNATFWTLCAANAAGYTAANCDYIFSGSIEECWIDDASNQPFFTGGLNNYLIANNTFEFKKGILMITGGTADLQCVNNAVNNSFDYFLQSTMNKQGTNNGNIISVRGLHVYTHNRGVLFSMIGAWSVLLSDVTLQAQSGAVVGNGIGLASLVTTQYFQISNCNVQTDATLTTGATGTILTLQVCTGMVSDCIFDGCDTGILLTGTGNNRIHFENVEIVNTLTAAFKNNVGTPAGLITASHCNWSDGQTNLLISTLAGAYDFYADGCRFMNAGLGGLAATRNITLATTGLVKLSNCVIGQNNAGAAAAYYLDFASAGSNAVLVSPIFVGTPPTAIQNPSATQQASIGRLVVPFNAGAPVFSTAIGDTFEITCTGNVVVAAPTSPMDGKKITITFRNTSGGAITIGFNAIFKVPAGLGTPATGFSRTFGFFYDGTNWIFTFQPGADTPN
jgi:hypothetical protein